MWFACRLWGWGRGCGPLRLGGKGESCPFRGSCGGRSPAGVLGPERPSASLFRSLALSLLLRNRVSASHWTPTPFPPWTCTPLLLSLAQQHLPWAASPTAQRSVSSPGVLVVLVASPPGSPSLGSPSLQLCCRSGSQSRSRCHRAALPGASGAALGLTAPGEPSFSPLHALGKLCPLSRPWDWAQGQKRAWAGVCGTAGRRGGCPSWGGAGACSWAWPPIPHPPRVRASAAGAQPSEYVDSHPEPGPAKELGPGGPSRVSRKEGRGEGAQPFPPRPSGLWPLELLCLLPRERLPWSPSPLADPLLPGKWGSEAVRWYALWGSVTASSGAPALWGAAAPSTQHPLLAAFRPSTSRPRVARGGCHPSGSEPQCVGRARMPFLSPSCCFQLFTQFGAFREMTGPSYNMSTFSRFGPQWAPCCPK